MGRLTLRRLRNGSPYRARSARQGGQAFSPAQLNPFAWYDAALGGSSTQITDSSANARAAATFGAGSNSPLFLAYTGTPYVHLPGVTGNFVSTPDSAALRCGTGTIEIVFRVVDATWSAGTQQTVVSKFTSIVDGYELHMQATNRWRFSWVSGGVNINAVATAATSVTTGWHRVLYEPNVGGSWNVTFFDAADSSTEPTVWSQVGSTASGAVAAIATGTTRFNIGRRETGTNLLASGVRRLILRNAGTAVADFDAASCTQTGYTGPLGNLWTVNRATTGRKTVVLSPAANSARSVILFGTDDWIDVPAAAIPPTRTAAATYWVAGRQWSTATNAGRYLSGNNSGMELATNGTALQGRALYNATGLNTATAFSSGTRFVLVGAYDSATTTLGTALNTQARQTATVAAAASDPTALRIGANSSGTQAQDFELTAFGTVGRVLTDSEVAQLTTYYLGGL